MLTSSPRMIQKKNVLFVATVTEHILNFHKPYLKWFRENGYITHVASNGNEQIEYCDKHYNIPFNRSPLSADNFRAYKQLKKIINNNDYALIHCHTPMGGVVTRLAARRSRKKGTKVLYTAHGFHFFKGAPIKNWLLFYPIEKILSHYTDGLITINSEDFNLAQRHKFRTNGIYHIHGVGVSDEKFHPVSFEEKVNQRIAYDYNNNQFIVFYAAEFISRKNHKFLIEAIPQLSKRIPNIKIILAGRGELIDDMKLLAKKLKVEDYVDFLGYRKDINNLLAISDVVISTSKQEGLPFNIIEGLFTGLPIVASVERGHNELVIDNYNGYRFEQNDRQRFINILSRLSKDKNLCETLGKNSLEHAQKFHINNAIKSMAEIYQTYLD